MNEVDRRTMFAVRKKGKYLWKYQNKKATWTHPIYDAYYFSDYEMASNFAGLTKGYVVSVEFIAKKQKEI